MRNPVRRTHWFGDTGAVIGSCAKPTSGCRDTTKTGTDGIAQHVAKRGSTRTMKPKAERGTCRQPLPRQPRRANREHDPNEIPSFGGAAGSETATYHVVLEKW